MSDGGNEYLNEVMEQQRNIERDLKRRAPARAKMDLGGNVFSPQAAAPGGGGGGAHDDDSRRMAPIVEVEATAVDVRVTGFWRWKNVVVPPNAYVVHTRRGHKKPLHIGLGQSFRFDPVRDSFLVVPATMQTIMISANCICLERQGILVQGYLQWIIEDFETAYKKLDFSDAVDPMRIVNVQLREQAEATIKDTVATMSVDAVLSDKQPIIKELTRRLREVAEGESAESGLGLRIVTVQIKEAVVSSGTLWETLQRPFRAERQKVARLAELDQQAIISQREAETERQAGRLRIETNAETARLRHDTEALEFDRSQNERARRAKLEAESMAQAVEFEKEKMARQAELRKLQTQAEIEDEQLRHDAEHHRHRQELELDVERRKLENDVAEPLLRRELIEQLPSIISSMPHPTELRTVNFNGADNSTAILQNLLQMLEIFRQGRNTPPPTTPPAG